jgi:hypothetical protein
VLFLARRTLSLRPPSTSCTIFTGLPPSRQEKATPDELEARAKANGYQRGTHWEEDSRRDCNKHKDKTKKIQDATLGHCDVRERCLYPKTVDTEVEYQLALPSDKRGCSPERTCRPGQTAIRERILAKNVEVPDLAIVKDFFRFCAATGKGKIVTKTPLTSLLRLTTKEEEMSLTYDLPDLLHYQSSKPKDHTETGYS